MSGKAPKGSMGIALVIMSIALALEALLIHFLIGAQTDAAFAEAMLTLSKIVIAMTVIAEMSILMLWVIFMRLALQSQRVIGEYQVRQRQHRRAAPTQWLYAPLTPSHSAAETQLALRNTQRAYRPTSEPDKRFAVHDYGQRRATTRQD